MKLLSRAFTAAGKRTNNNDRFYADDEAGLYAVADGCGRDPVGGEAAAAFIERARLEQEHLIEAARAANGEHDVLQADGARIFGEVFNSAAEEIYSASSVGGSPGSARTAGLLLALLDGRALIGHVGASRAYLLRDGEARALTTDHTLGQRLLHEGLVTPEDLDNVPHRRVLARSVGSLPTCTADFVGLDVAAGDRILLCSDGLHRWLDAEALSALGRRNLEEQGLEDVVEAAIAAGSSDNVTAILTEVVAHERRDEPAVSTQRRLGVLTGHFLFNGLTYQEQLRMVGIARERHVAPGETVVSSGDPGDRMFSVVSGTLEVVKNGVVIAELQVGDGFGEMAFSDGYPRSADVVARTPTVLLAIDRDDYRLLAAKDSTIAWKVMTNLVLNLSARLRKLSDDYVRRENE